jgi:hypothetical protein
MVINDSEKSKVRISNLEVNAETVQDLSDAEAQGIQGGYNSNGCGTAFSYQGQQTCDPDTRNIPSYRRCPVAGGGVS